MNGSSSETYVLSPEQIQFYNDNGYLVIKKLFDLQTLDKLRKRFVAICNKEVPFPEIAIIKDNNLNDGTRTIEYYVNKLIITLDEVFMKHTEDSKLLDIATQLVGNDVCTMMNGNFINKPPGSKRHPPHQDLFYHPIAPLNEFFNVWTAVDPATRDSGCLFVVPGSHKPQKLYPEKHLQKEIGTLFFELEDVDKLAPPEKRTHLEVDPGDTVLINGFLIHGSGPNNTQNFRKAICSMYASSHLRYEKFGGVKGQEVITRIYSTLAEKYSQCRRYLPADNDSQSSFQVKHLRGVIRDLRCPSKDNSRHYESIN